MSEFAPQSRRRRRQRLDVAFVVVCILAAFASLAVLAALLISIFAQGWAGLMHEFPSFLTGAPSRNPEDAGIYPAMIGTIFICLVCVVTAIPLGVGSAILMQEFRPRHPLLRRIHAFFELNITNLAGVPSIVYGILGLTVFVGMFGLLGNPNDPTYTIGATWYDEFFDESGALLRFETTRDAPIVELAEGMTLVDADTGQPVTLRFVQPGIENAQPGDITADAYGQRSMRRAWYYFQLPFGRGVLAGGLTLMLVVLPVVIIASQESLRAVPDSLRQGALALGATRWQMVSRMTLPAAIPGIMTGTILAMSRAIGEAAPILIITGIVYITFTPQHIMDEFTAMPLQIFNWASRPQAEFHRVAASGIIVLITILLCFNVAAIVIRNKFQRPLS